MNTNQGRSFMEAIEFWKFCPTYSVVQAALLITGHDPSDLQLAVERSDRAHPPGYAAVKTALLHAIKGGLLDAQIVEEMGEFSARPEIIPSETLIRRESLAKFLEAEGHVCSFFSGGAALSGRFNREGPYFSKKLDAANRAWEAVTSDPKLLRGKTPKQALRIWLEQNAADLDLLTESGSFNVTGIEEICKVANWRPEGGAPPTQTEVLAEQKTLSKLEIAPPITPPEENFLSAPDDEIPV